MQESQILQREFERILMPNSVFFEFGPDDQNLYMIDPATVAHLSYEILQYLATFFGVSIPIVGGANWAKHRLKKAPPPEPIGKYGNKVAQSEDVKQADEASALPEILDKDDLEGRIASLKKNLLSEKALVDAELQISKILAFYGWPETEAKSDAAKMIKVILNDSGEA